MSDFLFVARPQPPGRLAGLLDGYLAGAGMRAREWHGEWGSLAVSSAPHHPEPVLQDALGLSVLVGEPHWHPGGTRDATAPAARLDVHRALLAGEAAAWDDLLDGPFAALALRPDQGRVVTDLFSWIPVFRAALADGAVVAGTHVDAVARAAGVERALDEVSAAEFVAFFVPTFPYTLYTGVRQLPPGAEVHLGRGGWGPERVYWAPRETVGFASPREAAAALTGAVRADVAAACAGHDRVGLLLSGGEDARAVLGAIPPAVEVRTFTYAEADNREVRAARRASRACAAEHTFIRREPGHDLRFFPQVAGMIGSHNQFIDVHNFGISASLGLHQLPVVLGGLSSDALLKADNVRGAALKRLRRGLPPRPGQLRVPPVPGLDAGLLDAAVSRRTGYLHALRELRPQSADEWLYLYPFSMRKYAGNFHGSRRLFRSHETFHCNAVVKLAASVPQGWKIHRRLFHRAMRPFLRASWWVPHSRNRVPYFSHALNSALIRPLLGGARDLRDLLGGERGRNQESWPIWSELLSRPEARAALQQYPLGESGLAGILEPGAEISRWAPLRQLAALQLGFAARKHET